MECSGTTLAGELCRAKARIGTDRCWRHPRDADGPNGSRPRARDERWDRDAWLAAFELTGMVTAACRALGVGRTTVYEERIRNEDFAIGWADVEERTTERMEREAMRRAVEGTVRPITYKGEVVTLVHEYSDRLLEFLLKARKPEKYRENVPEPPPPPPRLDLSKLPVDDLAELERMVELAGRQ